MSFVIFDTEYTSWPGCLENGWVGTQKKEIVQIAAIKVSDDFKVLDSFNKLCKPRVNPVLSDYFVQLTNISNQQVDTLGVLFEEAYQEFVQFVGDDVCFSHSWGAGFYDECDGKVIKDNLDLHGITYKESVVFRNIAPVFKELYKRNNIMISSQSSGQIARILKLDKNIEHLGIDVHNALYDVYSVLEGLKYFRDDIKCISRGEFVLR